MLPLNKTLELWNYVQFCRSTAIYPNIGNNWQYALIGLTGELGELANKLKKIIRDDKGIITETKRQECLDELGDLFWYLIMLCDEMKINPSEVLENNMTKLTERQVNNALHDNKEREQLERLKLAVQKDNEKK